MGAKLTKPDRDKLSAAEGVLRRLALPIRITLDRTGACAVTVGDALAGEALSLSEAVARAIA